MRKINKNHTLAHIHQAGIIPAKGSFLSVFYQVLLRTFPVTLKRIEIEGFFSWTVIWSVLTPFGLQISQWTYLPQV